MKQHRVAILGGSGFIGRYVVKRLAGRGDVLTVGGRNAADAKFLKLKGDVGQVGLVNLSIDDERLLPAFVAGADTVINLVGILSRERGQRFDTAASCRAGAARAVCARGRSGAFYPCFGDRRRRALVIGLRPQQGGRRRGGA